MSFSSNFVNLIIDSNCDLSVKSKYLEEGRHFNHFHSLGDKQVDQIKQKINSLLAVHNKKLEAFLLLNKYLDECPHLVVLNESVSWSTACLQSSTAKNVFEKQLSFICLKKIFEVASNSPEIYRMLSGTIVPTIH